MGRNIAAALTLFMLSAVASDRLAAQEKVEARGITSVIKLEEVTFGHLAELNGKFKMRATEFTFAPGAYLGVHHHVGPGVRSGRDWTRRRFGQAGRQRHRRYKFEC